MLLLEHVTRELLQLSHLILNLVDLLIDLVGTTSDLLQIWTQNGKELLDDRMRLGQVLQDIDHILGLCKNLLERLEVPLLNRLLVFDFLLGVEEFLMPFLEHLDSLTDKLDGFVWILGLEDLCDVDLRLDLFAYLSGDASQDLLKLGLLSVDVARDGPNELETGEKRRQSLLNELQFSLLDVAELAVERGKELDEVPGLRLLLDEFTILVVKVIERSALILALLLRGLQDLLDSLHLRQV